MEKKIIEMCSIILPWEKLEYMSISNKYSPNLSVYGLYDVLLAN